VAEPIQTRVAHTGADELRFRGKRVFGELLGKATVSQMLVLGLSGRWLDGGELAVIDDIVVAMSSADPRLWPFKVTRLASAYGRATFGVAATLVSGEGGMYGGNRLAGAALWLQALVARGEVSDDDVHAALQAGGAGFGVLYRGRDERFDALVAQTERRGKNALPAMRSALQASQVARERMQIQPHVYLAIAALGLDLGLEPAEIALIGMICLFHDSLANASEGAHQAPAILRAIPSGSIDYQGPPPRTSPRATD